MPPNPVIPPRISSKRALPDDGDDDDAQAQQAQLLAQRIDMSDNITSNPKKLRPSLSFDSYFWTDAIACVKTELKRISVVKQIEENEFFQSGSRSADDWLESPRRDELEVTEHALSAKLESYEQQIERLNDNAGSIEERATQRSYVSCFLSSKLGADADVAAGRRSKIEQSSFRDQVFNAYHVIDQDDSAQAWDIVFRQPRPTSELVAAHLFAYRHGEDALVTIFGDAAKGDLFSPSNGLLLPLPIEEQLEKGIFTLYPNFPDHASREEREQWQKSEPKEWRIRFLDKPVLPTSAKAHKPLYHKVYDLGKNILWKDLDGKKLEFRSNARPKARYVYFHFLLNMLRFAWRRKEAAVEILEPELGMPYWGSPEKYTQKGQLRGFVDQLGHVLPDLAISPTRPKSDCKQPAKELSEALTSQIIMTSQKGSLLGEEYDTSEEED